jgi:cytochrome P450
MTTAAHIPTFLRRAGEFDPDPDTTALRDGAGIARVATPFGYDAWLVTRHADAREVLADARRFSVAVSGDRTDETAYAGMTEEDVARERAGDLMAHDPPEHTRLRRMLTPAFTGHQVRLLRPWIERVVADHLDAMERHGPPVDLVEAFALPVPLLVICELLGVPYGDRADFGRLSARPFDLTLPPSERTAAFREMRAYMATLAARIRARPSADGLLAALVREHGDEVTADELTGIGHLMLIAGHETTATMLALGALALMRHPDQLRIVRDHAHRVDAAVEELLRWLTILNLVTPRLTTEPVVLAGRRIEAGEMVLVSLPTANRDPALVTDPEVLDVTRPAPGHVAFGHGVHHCVGAPLARAELRIALPALLRRFPTLRLADPGAALDLRPPGVIYGVARLPVTW